MPLHINRVARGLLSFFESKTSGQPPQVLADEIRATVNLGTLLAWGAAQNIAGSISTLTSAEGMYFPATNDFVPQDETWLVLFASIVSRTVVAAGDAIGGALAFRAIGTGSILTQDHVLNIKQSFPPGELACFYMATSPIILHPGDGFGFMSMGSTIAAGAPVMDVNMRVLKLKV